MSLPLVYILALTIGVAAGVLPMLTLALVAWEAGSRRSGLVGTPLVSLAGPTAPWLFSMAAVLEFFLDRGPRVMKRHRLPRFIPRILAASVSGAIIALPEGELMFGAFFGLIGLIGGCLGGIIAHNDMAQLLNDDGLTALAESAVVIVAVTAAFNPL